MSIKRRIKALEDRLGILPFDADLDRELTEWLAAHPDFDLSVFFVQPEHTNEKYPNGIDFPDHLHEAYDRRFENIFIERNMSSNLTNIAKLGKELFSLLRG